MSLKLYEITEQFVEALDLFTDPNQEFNDAVITDTLESIVLDFEDKAIQIAAVIKTMNAEAEAIKQAMKPMADRAKAIESRADNLKAYLLHNMQAVGTKQIKSPWLVLNVQASSPSLNVFDEKKVPDRFKHEAVVVNIDKATIKLLLKDGGAVDGCELVKGEYLRIK